MGVVQAQKKTSKPAKPPVPIKNQLLLEVSDATGKRNSTPITLEHKLTRKKTRLQPNHLGMAGALLEPGLYYVHLDSYSRYDSLTMPAKKNSRVRFQLTAEPGITLLTTARLELRVIDSAKQPRQALQVHVTDSRGGISHIAHTDSAGKVYFDLRVKREYMLSYRGYPAYDKITLPGVKGGTFQYVSTFNGDSIGTPQPTIGQCLIRVIFHDLKNQPAPYEKVSARSLSTGTVYSAITDTAGVAAFHVPLSDTYQLSAGFLTDFVKVVVEKRPGLFYKQYTINFLTSEQIEQRKNEVLNKHNRRDSVYKANYPHPFSLDLPVDTIRDIINRQADRLNKKRNTSTDVFTTENRIAPAVFERKKNEWKSKLIVSDITGSMDPYMEDILIWHRMQLDKPAQNRYVFFNDGDNKEDVDKRIGTTGGIYHNNEATLEGIIRTMKLARFKGKRLGGDAPENDIEALLSAKKLLVKGAHLILIADNLSPVRDLELLNEIQYPVHIVVCGGTGDILEDYLTLAYKTKGSVHTLKKDFELLTNLKEGERLQINDKTYQLVNGRFVYVP